MKNWEIVPQTEKSGKTEKEVLVKRIKMRPGVDKKTGETFFVPLNFLMFRMLLKAGDKEHTVQWSNYGDQFKFTVKWPSVWVQPPFRNSGTNSILKDRWGNPIRDQLAKPIEQPGPKQVFDSYADFAKFGQQFFGAKLTVNIIKLFQERIDAVTEAAEQKEHKESQKRIEAKAKEEAGEMIVLKPADVKKAAKKRKAA